MKNNYTLPEAFDDIAIGLENSKLTIEAFDSVRSAITYVNLTLQYQLTDIQIFILAALLRKSGLPMTTSDFGEFASVTTLRIISIENEFTTLEQLGYIDCLKVATDSNWDNIYSLSFGVIAAIRQNSPIWKILYKDIKERDILEIIYNFLKAVDDSDMDYAILCAKMDKILVESDSIKLFHFINGLRLTSAEKVILLMCITWLIFDEDDSIVYFQYNDIIPRGQQRCLTNMFENNTTDLLVNDVLSHRTDSDGDTNFKLTEQFKETYLSDYISKTNKSDSISNTNKPDEEKTESKCDTIVEKQMFYNPREEKLIEELTGLLQEDNFSRIVHSLSDKGMRQGFTCLFYGYPGTGKTETVNQIARKTCREVIQVNMATIRNCYVGESEKNIQEIFDTYKGKVRESAICPILLFNEADAILCQRYVGAVNAVDKMENAIQNILLQNLEDFEGILIATTNLTSSLDIAFERRFLYKIEFQMPTEQVRQKLWKSMIPELTNEDALCLARKFYFSGGEIENIARKQLIESILKNAPFTLESLRLLCQSENILNTKQSTIKYKQTPI